MGKSAKPIFSAQHLIFNANVKNINEAFNVIAKKAKELGVTNSVKTLIDGFIKREAVSTTGMAESFAIPHTMSTKINFPAIIVVKFKNGVDWKAFDGKPVKVAVALLIPEKQRSALQVEYLARISTGLMNPIFNKTILTGTKSKVIEIINEILKIDDTTLSLTKGTNLATEIKNSKGLIVGVSACATGIAHTYMAREALEKHASEVGYEVWIETQGQSGQEHKLTDEMIKRADYVIIASDINVELDRFANKKIYKTSTNEAINTPVLALNKTISLSVVQSINKTNNTTFSNHDSGHFMKHFLNGVSHMIPFIVFSGIVLSVINAIAIGVYGSGGAPSSSTLYYASQVANIGFAMFTAVMGGYIAVSIAGRAGLAPGFIATFAASTPSMYLSYADWMNGATIGGMSQISGVSLGIVAAIMMGFGAGYLTNLFNRIPVHRHIKPIMPIIVIPVFVTSLLVFPFFFGLSGILGCGMDYVAAGLAWCGTQPPARIAIGFLLGAMIGFDMGGPINKIAFVTASTLIPTDPSIMGAVATAIPIAPLGCGLASVVFGRRLFSEEERSIGVSALALGFMGISEGAIPFAAKRLKPTFIANIIASAIGGGLGACFFVADQISQGGIIVALVAGIYCVGSSIPTPFSFNGIGGPSWQNILITSSWYILAIAIASLIHAILYIILIRVMSGETGALKNMFSHKKRVDSANATNISSFNWYKPYVIMNWYYQKVYLTRINH